MKTIDVIIPVYRPDEEFRELLVRLARQKIAIAHIILMHTQDGIELNWAEEICDNLRVISVALNEFDHGGTRDRGIRSSDADIVICMTQDAIPANANLVDNLVNPLLENDDVVVSYARQLPKEDCALLERYTRKFNYPNESCLKSKADKERLGIKTYFCSNVCAAYKRDKYIELGGFERNVIFNEDMIFAAGVIEHGYKIAYVADARVRHSHNYTNILQLKRNFDLAVSQADHPEIFEEIKSESEGIRMVKQTAIYLLKIRKPWLIIDLVIKSGCKFIGYFLGKRYQKLPKKLIKILTMNPRYWKN